MFVLNVKYLCSRIFRVHIYIFKILVSVKKKSTYCLVTFKRKYNDELVLIDWNNIIIGNEYFILKIPIC